MRIEEQLDEPQDQYTDKLTQFDADIINALGGIARDIQVKFYIQFLVGQDGSHIGFQVLYV